MVRASSSFQDWNRESTLLKPWAGEMSLCGKVLPRNSDVEIRRSLQGQYPSKSTNRCLWANNCYWRTLMCTMSAVLQVWVSHDTCTISASHRAWTMGTKWQRLQTFLTDTSYMRCMHRISPWSTLKNSCGPLNRWAGCVILITHLVHQIARGEVRTTS